MMDRNTEALGARKGLKERHLSSVRLRGAWVFIVAGLCSCAGGPEPSPSQLPDFLWPPPRASGVYVMPEEMMSIGRPSSLGDVLYEIDRALDQGEYYERSYYSAPGGFAVVTRLERYNTDGTNFEGNERWNTEGPPAVTGWHDYIDALFGSTPGYFRVIVFVVTTQSFSPAARVIDGDASLQLLMCGAVGVPPAVTGKPYTESHNITALIYELAMETSTGNVIPVMPGRLPAHTHLSKAGILSALTSGV